MARPYRRAAGEPARLFRHVRMYWTPKDGSSDEALLLYTGSCLRTRATARKGVSMRKQKDLNTCISLLEGLQGRGSADPEQRQAVGCAIDLLKRVRRKPDLRRHELYESIRQLVENLVRAFTNRD
jgi:hypothetical protein